MNVTEAIWPLWLIGLLAGSVVAAFLSGLMSSPDEDTRKIVILGSSGAGKTTLWDKLRSKIGRTSYYQTNQECVDSFSITVADKTVRIPKTKDIGGNDFAVQYYQDLINEDGTFIYFLVDLTKLDVTKQEIRARLQVISKIMKDKNLEKCGFKILATHFDEYSRIKSTRPEDAVAEVQKCLSNIKNCSIKIDIDHIMAVDLTNDFYVDKIKKEIALER